MGSKTIKQIDRELFVLTGLTDHYIEGQDGASYKVNMSLMKEAFVGEDMTSLSTAISNSLSIEIINRYSADVSLSAAITNTGAVIYKGTWDARTVGEGGTGTPPLSGRGYYYIVNISGSTPLTGVIGVISEWGVGDWAVHDGTYWDKIDNTEAPMIASAVDYSNPRLPLVSNVQEALDSGITYATTLLPLSMTVKTGGVGGIPDTMTVGDLSGKTFTQLFDSLLFPTVLASISQSKSGNLVGVTTATVENGTTYNPSTTATYNPGVIRNGDGSIGPNLTGNANYYSFRLPNGTIDNGFVWTTNTTGHTFSPYNVVFGTNTWSVGINHNVGTGTYYDNKGNPVTNLDSSRIAGSVTGYTNTVTGRRRYWWGIGTSGSAPTNSAGVRALTNHGLLDASDHSIFLITIPAYTTGVWFFIPNGKTVVVNYQESFDLDVTDLFVQTTLTVDGANGFSQPLYKSYVATIPGIGYTSTATYRVTITL